MHFAAELDSPADEGVKASVENLYIEHRPAKGAIAPTVDIAQHLQTRSSAGRVVVIADNPYGFHSALRKSWVALQRRLERERAKLLGGSRSGLTLALNRMHAVRFSSTPGVEGVDVLIVPPTEQLQVVDGCKTLYICCGLGPEIYAQIFDLLPKSAVVVVSRADGV
ncbi:hypothetical protein [Lentzea sp. NPDC051838]|uniref:hypothetical protein n=1 Tax=Lentzea sp. NPDC051838 TaxID=3154849 RepID=UPI003432E007